MSGIVHTRIMTRHYGEIVKEIETSVRIGLPFDGESQYMPPISRELKAVWDSGAMGTSISSDLARELGLVETGEICIEGVTGSSICNTYYISLHFPEDLVIPRLDVSDLDGNIGCDVLIGMDVITQGDMSISNFNENTVFSFRVPSLEHVDFSDKVPDGYELIDQKVK